MKNSYENISDLESDFNAESQKDRAAWLRERAGELFVRSIYRQGLEDGRKAASGAIRGDINVIMNLLDGSGSYGPYDVLAANALAIAQGAQLVIEGVTTESSGTHAELLASLVTNANAEMTIDGVNEAVDNSMKLMSAEVRDTLVKSDELKSLTERANKAGLRGRMEGAYYPTVKWLKENKDKEGKKDQVKIANLVLNSILIAAKEEGVTLGEAPRPVSEYVTASGSI